MAEQGEKVSPHLSVQQPFPYRDNFNLFATYLQYPFGVSCDDEQMTTFQYFCNFPVKKYSHPAERGSCSKQKIRISILYIKQ